MHSSTIHLSEKDFYQHYAWCINPLLSFEECLKRMRGEMEFLEQPLAEWQRNEVKLNFFLLAAAIDQITCDYLARDHYNFSRLADHIRSLKRPIRWLHAFNRTFVDLRDLVFDRSVARWRQDWGQFTAEIAATLLEDAGSTDRVKEIADTFLWLSKASLPRRLLNRRLKIPSSFRAMDLTHHDYQALARKFAASFPDRNQPLFILGLRSAGNYLLPLLESQLKAIGFYDVQGSTIRPKENALTRAERSILRRAIREQRRILIVDDPPFSGSTLRFSCELLLRLGASQDKIVLTVPQQPALDLREKLAQENFPRGIARIELDVDERWKIRWLHSAPAVHVVEEFVAGRGWVGKASTETRESASRERTLDLQQRPGLRFKKVFEIQPPPSHGVTTSHFVLAKSVGWGWFSYHAWLLGEKLQTHLPAILGLRQGVLFMEWIDANRASDEIATEGQLTTALASYLATRTREFPLPAGLVGELDDRGNGWDYIAGSLALAYGRGVGKLVSTAVRRRLIRQFGNAHAAFIDGKLSLDEWIENGGRLAKLDFEGHGFDNTDMFVIDPAFDLAGAIFEFSLSEDEEEKLLHQYADLTGDVTIVDRVPVFKTLYGLRQLYQMGERLASLPPWFDRMAGHTRFERARLFLMSSILKHYGQFLPEPERRHSPSTLFMMDVDGVLDEFVYEYPSTTLAGLEALAFLHQHSIPVVVNTGRSLEEVQYYSRFLHLCGGVAEQGTVLWDEWSGKEKILLDEETRSQLDRMRMALNEDGPVFFSPGYRTSLHCYTYRGGTERRGLNPDQVNALLKRKGFDRLRAICGSGETAIVARSLDKGTGLQALKAFLKMPNTVVHAIGNSSEDLPMFRYAEFAYAVANSSQSLKMSSRVEGFEILRRPSQKGLLEAARLAVRQSVGVVPEEKDFIGRALVKADPLLDAGRIADLPKLRRALALLSFDVLRRFQV